LGDLAAMFFFSPLASFDFDALSFLLSALTRGLFFHLPPAFLFGAQSVLGGQSRCFYLGPAAFFLGAQTH